MIFFENFTRKTTVVSPLAHLVSPLYRWYHLGRVDVGQPHTVRLLEIDWFQKFQGLKNQTRTEKRWCQVQKRSKTCTVWINWETGKNEILYFAKRISGMCYVNEKTLWEHCKNHFSCFRELSLLAESAVCCKLGSPINAHMHIRLVSLDRQQHHNIFRNTEASTIAVCEQKLSFVIIFLATATSRDQEK